MGTIKQKLKNGEPIYGTMLNFIDAPDIVEILKEAGFDYFMVDCEHGYMTYDKVAVLLALARKTGIDALVRVPGIERESILKYMEMGAAGLMLPNTDTAFQARKLVEYAKYAPLGKRGVSLARLHTEYKKISNASEYMQMANDDTVLIIQVESPESVENIDEIMQIEGIDAAFIGPNDLCQTMGIPGQMQHPAYLGAVKRVIESAEKWDKVAGIQTMNPDTLTEWIQKGMRVIMYSNDANMLIKQAQTALDQLRKIKEESNEN